MFIRMTAEIYSKNIFSVKYENTFNIINTFGCKQLQKREKISLKGKTKN